MRKLRLVSFLTLSCLALLSLCFLAQAGTAPIPSKEVMPQVAPSDEFYRAHEWDLNIWGTFAFSANPGRFEVPNDDPFTPDLDPEILVSTSTGTTFREPKSLNPNERVDVGRRSKDTFLGRDNSLGGGADVKFFWNKYFGAGVEGFLVDTATDNIGGAGLLTLTARYPMGRFAPYIWGGVGALAGGGRIDRVFTETHNYDSNNFVVGEKESFSDQNVPNKHVYFDGQLGVGIEYRVTRHIGFMVDFAWNFIAGHDDPDSTKTITTPGGTSFTTGPEPITFDNNQAVSLVPGASAEDKDFGMVRAGFTLSY